LLTLYNREPASSNYDNLDNPNPDNWHQRFLIVPITENREDIDSLILELTEQDDEETLEVVNATHINTNPRVFKLLETKTVLVVDKYLKTLELSRIVSLVNMCLGIKSNHPEPVDIYQPECYSVALVCYGDKNYLNSKIPGLLNEKNGRMFIGNKKRNWLFGCDIFFR
jgi:hypothetical protein